MEKESEDHLASSLPYRDTMEHRAAGLIGQKLAAAQLVYGDSVEGALVDQSDSGHGFLADLARSVIERSEVTDLNQIFRQVSLGGLPERAGDIIGQTDSAADIDAVELAKGVDTALSYEDLAILRTGSRQMALF